MRVLTQAFIESDPYPVGRKNHGRIWTTGQLEELRRLWNEGMSSKDICDLLGRSYRSIALKLEYLQLVKFDPTTASYRSTNEAAVPQQTQENIMAANIETKVFINGVDASELSDNQIFQRIAKLEGEMDKLVGIRAKSHKKQEAIDALQKDIDALVTYVDGR